MFAEVVLLPEVVALLSVADGLTENEIFAAGALAGVAEMGAADGLDSENMLAPGGLTGVAEVDTLWGPTLSNGVERSAASLTMLLKIFDVSDVSGDDREG